MTTQPKLPEWAEVFLKDKAIVRFTPRWVELLDKPGDDFMCMRDVQDLASRLMAEIVPEGYCVVPREEISEAADGLEYWASGGKCEQPSRESALVAAMRARLRCTVCSGKGEFRALDGLIESCPNGCIPPEQPDPGPAAEPNDPPCPKCKIPWSCCDCEPRPKQAEGGGKRSSNYKRCSMCDTDCAPDYPCMCPCHEGASHER